MNRNRARESALFALIPIHSHFIVHFEPRLMRAPLHKKDFINSNRPTTDSSQTFSDLYIVDYYPNFFGGTRRDEEEEDIPDRTECVRIAECRRGDGGGIDFGEAIRAL